MSRLTRAAGALTVAAGLTLTTLVAPATAAPRADDSGAEAGARWLAKELTGGLLHNSVYDFDDVGLSIDAALAMAAVKDDHPAVDRVAAAVAGQVDAYVGAGAETYGGATAKALVLAQTAGLAPRAFGGRDLVAILEQQVTDGGPAAGRLRDTSEYGDYANTIGQAFAVRGLTLAGSAEAPAATDFLLDQQCPGGYFRLYFAAEDAAEQGCVAGAAGSEPDTDVTALAVANLVLADTRDRATYDAVQRAVGWLRSQQRGNGSFGGGTSTSRPNANSTGLAATALGMTERFRAARKAAVWLRKLQPADLGRCRSDLTRDKGAIAYDRKALRAGRTDGLTGDAEDQWRRTSAQAVPALRYAPGAKGRLRVKVPGQARPGAKVRVQLRGLAKGEQACVWVKGKQKGAVKRVTGRSGKVTAVKLRLPRASGRVAVKVRTLDARAKTRVRVRR